MNQITHDNHFVPQMYLKQWSADGIRIWAYRILVSNERVPEWGYRSISRVANLRDLYTIQDDGEDIDDFERWLEIEFENPVKESIKKVLKDNPLTTKDWDHLAMFLGAQDVRTPLSYLESTERWEKTLPELLRTTLEKSIREFEQRKNQGNIKKSSEIEHLTFEKILDIQPVQGTETNSGQGYIYAELTAGRRLWLQSQKLLLTKTVNVLKKHKWSIARPARGYHWFTSDHPVVKMNYYGNGSYDLKGGWGNKGANIFMPISPRHLLFTQIGKEFSDSITFSSDLTRQIQSYIAKRAFRWIFAHDQLRFIRNLRPRHIDAELFNREADQWKTWHEHQIKAERSKNNPPNPNPS
jgi:hypothetical protein